MKRSRSIVTVAVLGLILSGSIGCTEQGIGGLLIVPVVNSAIDTGIDSTNGFVDDQLADLAGDSPLPQAVGNGISAAFGQLLEYTVNQALQGIIPGR